MSGKKYDMGKPRMSLIPNLALKEIAKVLTFGAKKYDSHNWRKGLNYSRVMDALLRHLGEFMDGEDLDPETGLSHIAHAACNVIFLLTFILEGRSDLDDRFLRKEVIRPSLLDTIQKEVDYYIKLMLENQMYPEEEDIEEIISKYQKNYPQYSIYVRYRIGNIEDTEVYVEDRKEAKQCGESENKKAKKKSQLGKCTTASTLLNSVRTPETPSSPSKSQESHTETSTSESAFPVSEDILPESKL